MTPKRILWETGDAVPLALLSYEDIEEMLGWSLGPGEMKILERFWDEKRGGLFMERGAAINLIFALKQHP